MSAPSRYFAAPNGIFWTAEWYACATADTVMCDEKSPIDTGLLDARGDKVFRLPVVYPLGFQVPGK